MNSIYFIDGEFVPAEAARIPAGDLAVLRGYGVFDFMRTYGGQPFHLEQHIARLFRSAEQIMLDMPWTPDEIKAIVLETLERNDHAESNVRIVVTGGDSTDYITPSAEPRLLVLVYPAMPPAAHYYTDGAKIITVREERYLPAAKTINYIPAIRALKQAKAQHAIEAIYTDAAGRALEGTTTNLFAFYNGVLVTPGDGILNGITRGAVLDLVKDAFPLEIRDILLDELYQADEVFITASNKQVMPIVQINDRTIGAGVPGELTKRVMTMFTEMAAQIAASAPKAKIIIGS
ncbi:MAG: aminotransferase class IV [Chitinophagaceae bacterium]|nr:aminotransferase class IV [Anaerolineae bacterium]